MRLETPAGTTGINFHASGARVAVGAGDDVSVTPGGRVCVGMSVDVETNVLVEVPVSRRVAALLHAVGNNITRTIRTILFKDSSVA
jgi:hypothetical protein